MQRSFKALLFGLGLIGLTACSGTERHVEAPTLNVTGATITPRQAVGRLFTNRQVPYRIALCEADQQTGECSDIDEYPGATGVGGLFLPLSLEMHAIDVKEQNRNGEKIEIETSLNAPVNKIPSVCGTVSGKIEMTSAKSAAINFPSTYCNWMAIGNVVQSASFSIDNIILAENSFTGFYKIAFYGTGNANGSGYYKGRIVPINSDE